MKSAKKSGPGPKKPIIPKGTLLNPFTESSSIRTPDGKKEVKTRRYKNLLGNPVEKQSVKVKESGPSGKTKRKEKVTRRRFTNPITGRTTEKTVTKVKGYGRTVDKVKY